MVFDQYDGHVAFFFKSELAARMMKDATCEGAGIIFQKLDEVKQAIKPVHVAYNEFIDHQRMVLYNMLRGGLSASTRWQKVLVLVSECNDPLTETDAGLVLSKHNHYHRSTEESRYKDLQSKQYYFLYRLSQSLENLDIVELFIVPYSDEVQARYIEVINQNRLKAAEKKQ